MLLGVGVADHEALHAITVRGRLRCEFRLGPQPLRRADGQTGPNR